MGLQKALVLAKGLPLPAPERSVLDFLARELPDTHALWSGIELFEPSGGLSEIDLLVLGHYGLYLVEVKAWSGELAGAEHGDWTLTTPGGKPRHVPSPIELAQQKARLIARLFAQEPGAPRVPVEPLVLLSGEVQIALPLEARRYVVTLPELCRVVMSGGDARLERKPLDEATTNEVRRVLGGIVRRPRPGQGRFRDELPLLLRDLVLDLREKPRAPPLGDEALEEVASAWIIACCFTRALEERGLLPRRLAGPGAEEAQRAHVAQHGSVAGYLLQVLSTVEDHPAGAAVLRDAPLWQIVPSDAGATSLLDFLRSSAARVHAAIDPWADLYEALRRHRRAARLPVATPVFVGDLILRLTLDPACEELGVEAVRVLDPACGSGLLLVQAFAKIHERLCRASPGSAPEALAREALDRIHGVDVESTAVMLTRAQLSLAYLDRAGASAPLPLHVVGADALLPVGAEAGEEASALLGGRYEVVITEPPFVVPEGPLRALYRDLYRSASGRASLVAPFIERCFGLAARGGFVGVFAASSFMKRAFGKALVEEVLAALDLTHVIDASGAYIPGHEVPTMILAGRNRTPRSPVVRVVIGKRAEPITPLDPAQGEVWSRLAARWAEAGYEDEYIAAWDAPRESLAKHPWSLGAGAEPSIAAAMEARSRRHLRDVALPRRAEAVSALDGVFLLRPDVAERLGIEHGVLCALVTGASIRAWAAAPAMVGIAPHERDTGVPRPAEPSARWWRFLWRYRAHLRARRHQGGRPVEPWWAWSRWRSGPRPAARLAHPVIARGTEAARVAEDVAIGRTAIGVEIAEGSANAEPRPTLNESSEDDLFAVLGFLNSSAACFWLTMVSPRMGWAGPGEAPISYDLGTRLADVPIPDAILDPGPLRVEIVRLARQLDELARERAAWTPELALARWDGASRDSLMDALGEAKERDRSCLRAMVSAQEDLDWLVYEAIGLADDTLRGAPGGASPEERPFAWTSDEPPRRLDRKLVEIWRRRRLATRAREELLILESAGYKRSFDTEAPLPLLPIEEEEESQPEDSAPKEGRARDRDGRARTAVACEGWLLDRVEEVFRGQGTPCCLGIEELTEALALRAGVREAVWVYRSNPREADLAPLVGRLVSACAVRHLAALRHTESGLEKRRAWEQAWEAQRREDAGEAVTAAPPPTYEAQDYLDMSMWRLRGKYDVPSERFLAYPDMGPDGATLFGWAGWSTGESAAALRALHEQTSSASGRDPARLVPLLAGLLELSAPAPEADLVERYRRLVEAEAQALGLTVEEIRAFCPSKGQRGRRAS